MNASKGLVLGSAAVAILVGVGVFAQAQGTSLGDAGNAASSEPPFSVQVPVGRLGDEATYVEYTRARAPDEWTKSHQWGFRIASTTRAFDSTGVEHDAIRVDWDPKDFPELNFHAILPRQYTIDLATRDVLARDYPLDPRVVGLQEVISYIGPSIEGQGVRNHSVAVFDFQGNTFATGSDLTESSISGFSNAWTPYDGSAELISFRREVVGRTVLQGEDHVGVVQTGTVRFGPPDAWRANPEDYYEDVGERYFLDQLVPIPSTLEFSETTWIGPSSPYPRMIESRFVVNGTEEWETLSWLARSEPGGDAVPWGVDSAAHHYRTVVPDLERSADGQGYPADGGVSPLEYPLSEAIQSIESDDSLVNFQVWRAGNAEHRLVRARLSWDQTYVCGLPNGGCTVPVEYYGPVWYLTYGVPAGDGFRIETLRAPNSSMTMNSEAEADGLGPTAVPEFSETDLPIAPMTIASAARIWRSVAPVEFADEPINRVLWSLGQTDGYYGIFGDLTVGSPEEFGRLIRVGHASREGGLPVDVDLMTGRSFEITLDAEDGRIVRAVTVTDLSWFDWGEEIAEDFGLTGTADTDSAELATEWPVRTLPLAALGAASLLTVFLLAYFYPALKYVGAQALALFIPGYAKIRKDEVLNNATRDQLLQAIRNEPGVTPPDLHRVVGGGWSTVVYHLGVLERNQLVSSLLDGRHKRFFPVDAIDHGKRGQLAALKNVRTKAAYDMVLEEPGLMQKAIARRLGIAPQSTTWHLKRLETAGLLGHDKMGRKTHYYANPAAGGPEPRHGVEVA